MRVDAATDSILIETIGIHSIRLTQAFPGGRERTNIDPFEKKATLSKGSLNISIKIHRATKILAAKGLIERTPFLSGISRPLEGAAVNLSVSKSLLMKWHDIR